MREPSRCRRTSCGSVSGYSSAIGVFGQAAPEVRRSATAFRSVRGRGAGTRPAYEGADDRQRKRLKIRCRLCWRSVRILTARSAAPRDLCSALSRPLCGAFETAWVGLPMEESRLRRADDTQVRGNAGWIDAPAQLDHFEVVRGQ